MTLEQLQTLSALLAEFRREQEELTQSLLKKATSEEFCVLYKRESDGSFAHLEFTRSWVDAAAKGMELAAMLGDPNLGIPAGGFAA